MNCAVYVRLCLAPHPPRLSAVAQHRTRATTILHSECNAMPHIVCGYAQQHIIDGLQAKWGDDRVFQVVWGALPKMAAPWPQQNPSSNHLSVYLFSVLPFSFLSPLSLPPLPTIILPLYTCTPFLTAEFSGSCSQFKVSFTYATCTVRILCHIDITSYAAMHYLSQVTITWQTFMICLCKYTVAQIWSSAQM